jgi:hypothetical protein
MSYSDDVKMWSLGNLAVNVSKRKVYAHRHPPSTNVMRIIRLPFRNEFFEKRIPYPHFVTTIHTLIRLVA